MRYALCCLLFFLVIFCCKKDETIAPEEEQEEEVVDNGDDDQNPDEGEGQDAESGSGFPLLLAIDDYMPNEFQLTSIKMYPSTEGGIYLSGFGSSLSIGDTAHVNWVNGRRGFYESNRKALFKRVINNRDIKIYQLDDQGEPQLSIEFPNDHEIDWEARMIITESAIYFHWLTGQPGLEHVLTIASLNLEGQLNWKKEFDFDQFIYEDVVEHNGLLFIQYGNFYHLVGLDHVRVATVNDSGDIVNDFELKTNLAEWNKPEPLVELQVDDDFIYSNTTKNDFGLNRKSRFAKYTYNGDLINEVEVLYSRDFYLIDKEIYAVGNDYEVDGDIRKGFPFVIHLDENLTLVDDRRFDNVKTNWNQITVSDGVVYFYFYRSEFDPERPLDSDSLHIDTLRVK